MAGNEREVAGVQRKQREPRAARKLRRHVQDRGCRCALNYQRDAEQEAKPERIRHGREQHELADVDGTHQHGAVQAVADRPARYRTPADDMPDGSGEQRAEHRAPAADGTCQRARDDRLVDRQCRVKNDHQHRAER